MRGGSSTHRKTTTTPICRYYITSVLESTCGANYPHGLGSPEGPKANAPINERFSHPFAGKIQRRPASLGLPCHARASRIGATNSQYLRPTHKASEGWLASFGAVRSVAGVGMWDKLNLSRPVPTCPGDSGMGHGGGTPPVGGCPLVPFYTLRLIAGPSFDRQKYSALVCRQSAGVELGC